MRLHLPKHSTVVAYGALFIALGGTSYAATSLPRNSVGDAQIKPKAVTLSDLAPSARPLSKVRFNADVADSFTTDDVLQALSDAVRGDPGAAGPQGAQGPTGSAGANGTPGATGATGQTGVAGQQGVPGPSGSSVGGAYVAADGTSTDARYLTISRYTQTSQNHQASVGAYCIDYDHGQLPSDAVAVATAQGNGTDQVATQVQATPTSGSCAGADFLVTTMQGQVDTDEPFTLIVG